ncbi:hypothetical protein C7974DRAFT_320749 [Boeremia exigua]|uniref:uncharacterized protein n=1 Tax=Boeremia exigua TaxID=749465 RepID=UPI001E8DA93C|nr:uncharacterized protein C7974DRAFT_320749 [Boeremia exigua]KAH6614944.1 hypothetical protein C7974DRAFT_320749 [Boeremia exigua]
MPLEIHPLRTIDSLSWNRTRALAYYGPTHDLLHNGPVSETSIRGLARDREREIGNPNVWHWKIVDTELAPSEDDPKDNGGRTISIAVWKLMNKEAPTEHASVPAEIMRTSDSSFLPPELRLDALMSLFDPLDAARDEIMGTEKPYFMLNSLATHPDHHRRGAAKLLLDWGIKKADDEGLVLYLDATELARPIYAKRGFELKRTVEWDRKVWGGEGVDVHYCMVRLPHSGQKK